MNFLFIKLYHSLLKTIDQKLGIFFLITAYSLFSFGSVTHINEMTHIEIPSINKNEYELKVNDKVLSIIINKPIRKNSLAFQNYTDPYVKGIKVKRELSQTKIDIQLIGKNIKVFDYLTLSPDKLSVDLYIEEVKSKKERKTRGRKKIASKSQGKKRLPASDFIQISPIKISKFKKPKKNKAIKSVNPDNFSILNFNFEKMTFRKDAIIESRGNVYLKFPMMMTFKSDVDELINQRVTYKLKDDGTKIYKEVNLLKRVFLAGNYKKFLVSKQKFDSTYKDTKYKKLLSYMEADAMYYLHQENNSKSLLQRALAKFDHLSTTYPDSALTERTILFSAFARLKSGDNLGAIKNLKFYLEKYRKSPLKNQIRIFLAQALIRVKNHKTAIMEFDKIMLSNDFEARKDAAYNIGNAHFDQKEYRKAIMSYKRALTKYSEFSDKYASIYFNKAEAEFIEEQYRESLLSFKKFIELNPHNNNVSYAYTRIGEILEIVGAGKEYWKTFYNISEFKGGVSSGASIAKVHLLAKKLIDASDKRVRKIMALIKDEEAKIDIKDKDEFVLFKIVDALFVRKEYKKCTDLLIGYIKNNGIPSHKNKFYRRIGKSISYQARKLIDEGKPIAALNVIEGYDDLWIRRSERMDFEFLRAHIYNKLKFTKESNRLLESFLKKLNKLPSKEDVKKFEALPSESLIHLIIADNYLSTGDYNKVKNHLSKVDKKLLNKKNLSKMNEVAARYHHNHSHSSSRELASIKKALNNKDKKDMILTIDAISDMSLDHIESLLKIDNMNSKETLLLLVKKSDIYLKNNNKEKYRSSLKEIVDGYFDSDEVIDEQKYKYGKILIDEGNRAEGVKLFDAIQPSSVWFNMAKEEIKEKKWNNKYKKFLKKIPLVSEMEVSDAK